MSDPDVSDPDVSDVGATDVVRELAARQQTVAVAESLTGGALLAALTAPAGASLAVRGGVVAYATDTKVSVVGVDPELVARVGPVDLEVARQLARGARERFAATYGIGITGVAGPDGQHGHPVGEVHLAVAGPHDVADRTLELAAAGDRAAIRRSAVDEALELVWQVLREASD